MQHHLTAHLEKCCHSQTPSDHDLMFILYRFKAANRTESTLPHRHECEELEEFTIKGITEIHLSCDIFTQEQVPLGHLRQKKAQIGDSAGYFLSDLAFKKPRIMPHCLAEVVPSFIQPFSQTAFKWISR